jgi:hypothetical protein
MVEPMTRAYVSPVSGLSNDSADSAETETPVIGPAEAQDEYVPDHDNADVDDADVEDLGWPPDRDVPPPEGDLPDNGGGN